MVENRHFAKSVNLTLPCALYMSKNVLFCPGQRLPQFGDDQQKYSEDLPKCAFFAHFQVVISNAYPLIWLFGPMDTMGSRTWHLLHLEVE